MMNNEELGKIIQERMQELGISLMDLSRISGVNWSTIRGYIIGRHGATLDAAARVLDALGLKLVAIAKPKDEQRGGETA